MTHTNQSELNANELCKVAT